jgi:cathepsin F
MAMHLRIVLLIVALGSVAGQLRSHGDHQSEGEDVSQTAKFEEFKSQFSRKYATQEEEEYRFGVFRERDGFIDEFNAKQAANGPLTDETMLLGHNEFSDMSLKEFTSKHLGFKKMDDSVNVPHKPSNTTSGGLTFWKDFDWADGTENPKKASMVTSIDQQGDCGSCYAFAGVGALESAIAIHTGSLVKLSRQEIVDCAGYACEVRVTVDV